MRPTSDEATKIKNHVYKMESLEEEKRVPLDRINFNSSLILPFITQDALIRQRLNEWVVYNHMQIGSQKIGPKSILEIGT